MNWGHKVTIAFVLFAGFIMYMVVRAFNEDIDLVADDYYAREIAHEQKMDQLANSNALESSVTMTQEGDQLVFSFPKDVTSGNIHLYHIASQKLDRSFSIPANDGQRVVVALTDVAKGNYRVNLSWTSGKENYLQQFQLYR